MKFILINEDDNLIYNMDITNEINNAIGVTGFEFIKKDNIWRIHVLGEDLKYDINKLISTL